jgi:L-amino acid N-acyltransferase YncA
VIRPANDSDSKAIAEIYNHFIENTVVTFEEETVSAREISSRIEETQSADLPYLIAESAGEIIGYAYASKWKGRCSYRFSVEITVYLAVEAAGQGHGSRLYKALFSELRERQYHVAIAGITLPNPASVALHERFGMEKVAHFSEIGFKFGNWVDVGYWQVKIM